MVQPEGTEKERRGHGSEDVGIELSFLARAEIEVYGMGVELKTREGRELCEQREELRRDADGAIGKRSNQLWTRDVEDLVEEGSQADGGVLGLERDGLEVLKVLEAKAEGPHVDEDPAHMLEGDVDGGERGNKKAEKIVLVVGHEDGEGSCVVEDGKIVGDVIPKTWFQAGSVEMQDDGPHEVRFVNDAALVEADKVVGNGDGESGPDQLRGGVTEETA